jgi:hypothetical protein
VCAISFCLFLFELKHALSQPETKPQEIILYFHSFEMRFGTGILAIAAAVASIEAAVVKRSTPQEQQPGDAGEYLKELCFEIERYRLGN